MIALVITNFTNVIAEFAGIASSLELFHISRYISVPICAVAVWLLIVRGNYASVEKIFLVACCLYVTYVVSAFLLKPDWKEALKGWNMKQSPQVLEWMAEGRAEGEIKGRIEGKRQSLLRLLNRRFA